MTKKIQPEIQLRKELDTLRGKKTDNVSHMESVIREFDIQSIFTLNEELRKYYEKDPDKRVLSLLDRMTIIMRELTEIINQVKSKRISLEQGQKEILEKLQEINEVLEMMKDWEATGI